MHLRHVAGFLLILCAIILTFTDEPGYVFIFSLLFGVATYAALQYITKAPISVDELLEYVDNAELIEENTDRPCDVEFLDLPVNG